jgi:hypothetical protein
MKCIISIFFFCWIALQPAAGQSSVETLLLQRMQQLQVQQAGVFPKGMFPSYRMYALNKDREKADINGFFTGLISFTLRDLQPLLSSDNRLLAGKLLQDAQPVFDKFRNRKGRPTYNFWPTDTPQIFPNAGWLNLFDKSQSLPDDLDDTVILLLAEQTDRATAEQVHALMQSYTNNGLKRVRNTFQPYRMIGAYSTWFGNKMPVDFDVSVLANILYFVQRHDLRWTAADSASLQLIVNVIDDQRHITHAPYVSPHYSRLPVILYHLSRLMSVRPIPLLEDRRQQLIEQALAAMDNATGFMDQVILSTALLRWGVKPPVVKPRETENLEALIEEEDFSFFIANMASMLPDPLKQWVGGAGVGKFYYHCPAYNYALVLEYMLLNRSGKVQ